MSVPRGVPVSLSARGPSEGPPTPPPDVPLTFLAAAGAGLVAAGVAVALAADRAVVWPGHPGVVSATHTVMLAFLTVAVLGALHQFGPAVAGRRLRSVAAARVTAVVLIPSVAVLAGGFAHGPSWTVRVGGIGVVAGVLLAAWNLSGPLAVRTGGVAIVGLRCAVSLLVLTAAFGIVYAFDRDYGWFPLLANRVMAHAHLGLLGWMGLTYVVIAEKLWPTFLVAERRHRPSNDVAVICVAVGAPVVTTGLLFAWPVVATAGGAITGAGLAAHCLSLVGVIRDRAKGFGLLHAYVISSTVALIAGIALAIIGGLAPLDAADRPAVVAAEIAALATWLGLAVIGHAHKIVPHIRWTALFGQGRAQRPDGTPLLFEDLSNDRAAGVTYLLCTAGFFAVIAGLLTSSSTTIVVGGLSVSIGGLVAVINLATGARRATGGADAAAAHSTPLSRSGTAR